MQINKMFMQMNRIEAKIVCELLVKARTVCAWNKFKMHIESARDGSEFKI